MAEIQKLNDLMSEKQGRRHAIGLVYVLEADEGRVIKVGFTTDLAARIRNIRSSHPYYIDLFATYVGTLEDEKKIHERLRPHRLVREWYHPNEAVYDLFEDIYEYQFATLTSQPDAPSLTDDGFEGALQDIPIAGFLNKIA